MLKIGGTQNCLCMPAFTAYEIKFLCERYQYNIIKHRNKIFVMMKFVHWQFVWKGESCFNLDSFFQGCYIPTPCISNPPRPVSICMDGMLNFLPEIMRGFFLFLGVSTDWKTIISWIIKCIAHYGCFHVKGATEITSTILWPNPE